MDERGQVLKLLEDYRNTPGHTNESVVKSSKERAIVELIVRGYISGDIIEDESIEFLMRLVTEG